MIVNYCFLNTFILRTVVMFLKNKMFHCQNRAEVLSQEEAGEEVYEVRTVQVSDGRA